MRIVIDIDGTLCDEDHQDMVLRQPYRNRINRINELYDQGHEVIIFTSRGMHSTNNDPIASDRKYRKFTESQLAEWNVKYHSLFFGKPNGDFYIDNKNAILEKFFKEF